MPFPYYNNLSATKKRIYRKSDAIANIPLTHPESVHPVSVKLKKSLEDNRRGEVAKHASEICRLVCEALEVGTLSVKIRSKRPSRSMEELQGLYELTEDKTATLTVWMKTAAKGQVDAFKSFIRTLLHELCHHLDFTYFNLDDSFHTEGFFKRESFLYRQIIPKELQKREPRKSNVSQKSIKKQHRNEPEQMDLFRDYSGL